MSVLIDPPLWPAHGRLWSHLVSDTSLEELHAFARAAGVPERGFEGDHYDVPDERYADLIRAGAQPVGTRELLKRLQLSGLRRQKRRGERILSSDTDRHGLRVDTVRSPLAPPTTPATVRVVLQAADALLVDATDRRLPRLAVIHDDLDSGRVWVESTLHSNPGLARLGYLRHTLGKADPRGSFAYDSVLHLQIGGRPGPSGSAATWAWHTLRDVVAAESERLRPLLGLLDASR